MQSQADLEDVTKRSTDLQTKVADMDREIIGARAQLSAAEKGGIDAIDELKSTDKLISESLKAELDRLREDYRFAVNERDAQKSQLIEALLAKDKLRKDIEEGRELQDAAVGGPADADASDAAKKSGEKIEKLRARLKERKQVSLHYHRNHCKIPSAAHLPTLLSNAMKRQEVWPIFVCTPYTNWPPSPFLSRKTRSEPICNTALPTLTLAWQNHWHIRQWPWIGAQRGME